MTHPLADDLDHILEHTAEVWEELRGQQIFITGGTGFFGRWLLESFAWANEKLSLDSHATVLTRSPEAFGHKMPHLAASNAIAFHKGDIRNFSSPFGSFSHVIHAATPASASMNLQKPLEMLETIITGTHRVLEFTRLCGATKLLFTSSGAVYGKQPSILTHLTEDYSGAPDPLSASSAYGEGKRAAEQLCALYSKQYGLETKIARCFAFVGPYLSIDGDFAIGNFIRDGLNGGPIRISGDGTPYRSYLYASDLMIWLWRILVKGQPVRAYNVGAEEDLSISDWAHKVASQCKTQVEIARKPVAGSSPERYVPSTERAQRELALKTWTPADEAIAKTLRWHRIFR